MHILCKYLKPSIPFILALITWLVLLYFKNNPLITERVFSQGFYPIVAGALSYFSSWFPFSLDDLFYIGLALFFVGSIVLVVFKKLPLGRFFLRFFQLLAIVFCMFYWFWGFNYYRCKAHERINMTKTKPDTEFFNVVFKKVIEKANSSYVKSDLFNQALSDAAIERSFSELADFLNISYPTGIRRVKCITFSNFYAKATILGYYGPFFNEVHMNKYLPTLDVPVTMAHEKSHQFGITGEAEASFYGWMVCVKSDEPFVRYSGWFFALNYFIYQAQKLEEGSDFIKMIKPEVIEDLKVRHKYWLEWRNEKIDEVTSKMNDAYLKSNGVEKGVEDYNDVVQLIVDFYGLEHSF